MLLIHFNWYSLARKSTPCFQCCWQVKANMSNCLKLCNYFWSNHFSILKILINCFFLKGKYYLGTHMKPLCRKITSSIKELFYLRGNESFKGFFGNASYWIIKLMVSNYKRSTILKPSDHLFTELSKNSTSTRSTFFRK